MKKHIKFITVLACVSAMILIIYLVLSHDSKNMSNKLDFCGGGHENMVDNGQSTLPVSNDGKWEVSPVQVSELLTINQTIGAVYVQLVHGTGFNFYRRANPKSKKYLYKILADKNQVQYHHSVWRILGYIGDGSDVKLLEKTVRTYSGLLSGVEQDNIFAIFDCLGLMCARDIKEASTLVDKMQNPRYWKNLGVKLSPKPMQGRPSFEYDIICSLMIGYSLSGKSDFSERSLQILKSIQNSDEKSIVQAATSSTLLLSHGANMRKSENEPVSIMLRKQLAKLFNDDLQNPGPVKLTTGLTDPSQTQVSQPSNSVSTQKAGKIVLETQDDLGNKVSENLFKESVIAFEGIRSATLAEKYEKVLELVLDNGKILDKPKVREKSKEYKSDLQIEYRIFQLSKELETKYETPIVQRSQEIDEKGKVLKEVVTVSFKWTGTSEITPKVFARKVNRRTFMKDGTLVILMRRIDGKWYWNPFGW